MMLLVLVVPRIFRIFKFYWKGKTKPQKYLPFFSERKSQNSKQKQKNLIQNTQTHTAIQKEKEQKFNSKAHTCTQRVKKMFVTFFLNLPFWNFGIGKKSTDGANFKNFQKQQRFVFAKKLFEFSSVNVIILQ